MAGRMELYDPSTFYEQKFKKSGIPYLHSPLPPRMAEHPRYKLRNIITTERSSEEKETVRVKYYIHEKTFRERLKNIFITNHKSSVRWHSLRIILFLLSCIAYLIRALLDTEPKKSGCGGCPVDRRNTTKWCCPDFPKDNIHLVLLWVDRPLGIWAFQTGVAIFSIFDAILSGFLSYKGSFIGAIRRYMVLEIVTALPFIISIFWYDIRNIVALTFLHIWIAKDSAHTVLNDLHRKRLQNNSAITQKVTLVVFSVICLIVTSVCGLQHLERAHGNWTMFQALWFVVVTFSTVGYGDTVPRDNLSRTWVMIMIIMALLILPAELEELAFLLVSKQKEGGVYSTAYGADRHVVVCSTALRASTMIDFLNEFYADPKMEDVQVVLLSPAELESKLRILLQVPLWAQRVTYLKGSALNDQDLIRARVIDAVACFILTDRGNPDVDARDHQTIVRTWAIQDFAPTTPLYVQIHKPENKFHVSFADHVVCEDELKNALLASNCICPGISTMVTLLLHTLREQKGTSSDLCENIYGRSAGNEIYHIQLGHSKMFRRFAYKSFTYAAYNAFKRYGVTLIGARREPKDSQIFLNPGPNFKLAYDDTLFYIAITSEEDMALEELTKKSQKGKHLDVIQKDDGKRTRKLTRQSEWGSFISVIDNSEEEKSIGQNIEMKATQFSSNGSLDHSNQLGSPQHASVIDINISTASDFNELPTSDLSEPSSDNEGQELSIPIQNIPNYIIGVPPITPYVGRSPLKCHLLPEPKQFCCMELNKTCTKQHKLHDKGGNVKNLSGAVIVACPRAGAGLYNFILPLRAYHQPKCYLKPLVLLLNERPSPAFYEAVCSFPLLYFMVGSFKNIDDLLQAGILEGETVVVTDQLQSMEGLYSDEEYMADAYTIVGVQTIYRLFPNVDLIVELTHSSNMKFMKFDVPTFSEPTNGISNKESLRNTIKLRRREMKSRNDHLDYLFRGPFAAGNVFSASMIDTLLYQTFMKDYMIKLIALLLGCEQNSGSGYLASISVTENNIWIKTYGRLFQRLCTTTYDIPIGLFRHVKCNSQNIADRIPESRDIYGIVTNRMNRLGLKGKHDLLSRQGKSYSLVNPPPDFDLEEGDIVYIIRRSPSMATGPMELSPNDIKSTTTTAL